MIQELAELIDSSNSSTRNYFLGPSDNRRRQTHHRNEQVVILTATQTRMVCDGVERKA
jgi:hypothetical protein